ncbi:MAG: hypothetical protein OXI84_07165, partial [bacterium]|nr:hypothetical protein [bacterium]
MAVEMAIWRMTDRGPSQLKTLPLDSEARLEDMLYEDPGISGIDLLIVGRQVRTSYGGYIDWSCPAFVDSSRFVIHRV